MTQLGSMLAAGQTPPRGTVAITFDDGYLDTLRIAAPILDEAGLPATVYLPTWYIDRAKPQWVDELFGIFTSRRAQQLVTECGTWNLSNDHAARAAQVELNRVLLEASLDARERLLGQVRESLKPSGESPRLTMNWDEVRELVRRFPRIELGAHTVHHLDLRRWTGIEAEREISASAATIERETHVRPRHFSFPYGRRCEETRNMVQQAGFETAVGAGSKVLLGPASDRWALPRIEGHVSVPALKFLTSGAYTGLPWVV
ncbi:MAG: polysaccharide deacetylase family protein [Planctomycetota bacterium]|nr:polysaccharide deacetylase family protein [Planctomycetota bacterium]